MKTYLVEARLVYPSGVHVGYDCFVHAKTKAEAIKKARKQASISGHTRHDGPLKYTAYVKEDVFS